MKPQQAFRIVFMGTPAFAVPSLEILHNAGYPVLAVVTAPDKPAGRGLKPRPSAVKLFAKQHHIPVLQPVSLKDDDFITSLARHNADIFVVVAFRMLPALVWRLPKHGTINLHASLLPQYRGAAPINWVIINGEQQTGATTFLIDHEIDTGKILMQKGLSIALEETAGELHDRLMKTGAELVLKTIDAIRENKLKPIDQHHLVQEGQWLKKAPKITNENCRINWNQNTIKVCNLIRGLSPYPAAFTTIQSPEGVEYHMKIYKVRPHDKPFSCDPGGIVIDAHSRMLISTSNGFIELLEIKLAGKLRMKTRDFLNGFKITTGWKAK